MADTWQTSIEALILDMDGVLWRANEAIGDLGSIFSQIQQIGWKVAFATNNATRTVQQYVDFLASFNVQVEHWQVVTSAHATAKCLVDRFPKGGPVYIIGEQGLVEACEQQNFYHSEADALAVVAGMDRKFTYDKLKTGTILLRKGIPFIGTNPDRTFPTPQGLIPGAGSILAALSTASDVTPLIAGKPQPTLYEIALDRLKTAPGQTLVVGDRPETDIIGAQQMGCHTALVLSGVSNQEQALAWRPAPDLICQDLHSLVNMAWK